MGSDLKVTARSRPSFTLAVLRAQLRRPRGALSARHVRVEWPGARAGTYSINLDGSCARLLWLAWTGRKLPVTLVIGDNRIVDSSQAGIEFGGTGCVISGNRVR